MKHISTKMAKVMIMQGSCLEFQSMGTNFLFGHQKTGIHTVIQRKIFTIEGCNQAFLEIYGCNCTHCTTLTRALMAKVMIMAAFGGAA